MSVKSLLVNYAMQFVENKEVAEKIVSEAIYRGVEIGLNHMDGEMGQRVMIIETRNKCYDYLRLNKKPMSLN